MSRIGKKVITVPKNVTVTIRDGELEVKGPKGTLLTPIPEGITFKLEGDQLQGPIEDRADPRVVGHAVGLTQDEGSQAVVVHVAR